MKHYQLVLVGRNSQTHDLHYQITHDGRIIEPTCTYQEGYAKLAKLMLPGDTFQEVEGARTSDNFTYSELLNGYTLLNWDDIHHEKGT